MMHPECWKRWTRGGSGRKCFPNLGSGWKAGRGADQVKGDGDHPEETEEQKERNEQIMGTLRAAEKKETELYGVEAHFLRDKDAVVLVMVDLETREVIEGEAETFSRALLGFDLCYRQAEYMAVMPSFIDAAEFADKYKAMGFKVNMIIAPQGKERMQLRSMHDFLD